MLSPVPGLGRREEVRTSILPCAAIRGSILFAPERKLNKKNSALRECTAPGLSPCHSRYRWPYMDILECCLREERGGPSRNQGEDAQTANTYCRGNKGTALEPKEHPPVIKHIGIQPTPRDELGVCRTKEKTHESHRGKSQAPTGVNRW